MPRVALFLGAGASRAFGYPTTKELLNNLDPRLSSGQAIVVTTLKENKNVNDIEHILQMLDSFLDFDSRPLIREFLRKQLSGIRIKGGKGTHIEAEWIDFVGACRGLRKVILSELYTQYQFNENKLSHIVPLYERLFGDLATFNRDHKLDIFTTNYDSVIEEFHVNVKLDLDLIDGFSPVGRSQRLLWKPEVFERGFSKDSILKLRLFKLHGSLNWCERADGNIEKISLEQKIDNIGKYRRNVLIYPTQKTYEEEKPFGKLFEYFQAASKVSNILVVIGFSCRDDVINRIFLNHLGGRGRRRLVVVSPSATKNVAENLLKGKKKRVDNRIRKIDAEFGKDETFELIERALKSR